MNMKKLHGRNGLALVTAIGVSGLAGLALVVAPRLAIQPSTDVAPTVLNLPLEEGQTLRILNTGGRISVCAGEGDAARVVISREPAGDLSVIARAVSLWSPSRADDSVKPAVRTTDHGAEVSTLGVSGGTPLAYRVEVTLPRGRHLDIQNGNGTIAAAGIEGDVTVRSDNGDVRCEDISGKLIAHARNGGVVCRYVAGAADLSATNGAIEFEGIPAQSCRVVATASNGAIKFRAPGFASGLSAATENGRIVCDLHDGKGVAKTLRTLELNAGDRPAEAKLYALNGNVYVDTN